MLEILQNIDVTWIVAVLSLVAGFFGKSLINTMKDYLGWQDKQAVGLATGVSLVLGVAVAILSGEIASVPVDLEAIGAAWTVVYTFANLIYKVFWKEPE